MSETKVVNSTPPGASINPSTKATASTTGLSAKILAGGAVLGAGALAAAAWAKQPVTPDATAFKTPSIAATHPQNAIATQQQGNATCPGQEPDTGHLKERFEQGAQLLAQLEETHNQIQNGLEQLQTLKSSIHDAHAKLADIEAEVLSLPQVEDAKSNSDEDSNSQDDSHHFHA